MVTSYENPIIRGMYPDPSIVRVNSTYYMVNSTFEYFPGITVSRSTDLLNWERLSGAVTLPEQAALKNAKPNEGIFAVCIRYHDGIFYVITTNFAEFKTIILTGHLTDDDAIQWDKQRITIDLPGIDPDLFFEDGRTYVQFTGYVDDRGTKAIQQVEIDITTGQILQEAKVLSYGTGGRDVEGPHIIKRNGAYYLLTAEGGTGAGHMITIFKSNSLWGPYTDENGVNPLFTNRDRAEEPLQSIGHADLFQDTANNWWLVCLGTRPVNVDFKQYTNIGRETMLYPVSWTGAWPKIYTSVPSQKVDLLAWPEHMKALSAPQRLADWQATMQSDHLDNEWTTIRSSLADHLVLTAHSITVTGGETRLESESGTPSFIGVRQSEINEVFEVELGTESALNTGDFGLAVHIDNTHFAAMLLSSNADGSVAVYRQLRLFDMTINEKIGQLSQLPDRLSIKNTAAKKEFNAQLGQTESVRFTTEAIDFSNEATAALNTGDIEGLYVLGNAKLEIMKASRRKSQVKDDKNEN